MWSHRGFFPWLALLLTLLAPTLASAQFDPSKSPIVPAPLERYDGGELRPLAIYGDNSAFDLDNLVTFGQSLYQDLDIEGGFLFVAADKNLEIYDIDPAPSVPNQPLSKVDARLVLPFWGNSDGGYNPHLRNIRAATTSLVAIGVRDMGFTIWNTTNKAAPTPHYQDKGISSANQMHIATIGATHWAFVAGTAGLFRYNLSAAVSLNNCLDDSPNTTPCGSVYQGEVGALSGVKALAGSGNFVALVPAGINPSVMVYDVSSPLSPTVKLTGSLGSFPISANDVALWQRGGTLYMAVLVVTSSQNPQIKIYDIDCATTPGSCSLPGSIKTLTVPWNNNHRTLSASTTGTRDFLYVGNTNRNVCVAQREALFDVTAPSAAFDITPMVHPDGYWGWYYMNCATGSNNIAPHRGYFSSNGVFYRAALAGLDAHEQVGASPPIASFTCLPVNPFVGQTVTCTDTSSGSPDQWSWTFQDATPPTSTFQNPSVVFNAVGAKQVTLVSTNSSGPSNTAVATINVVDPSPSVDSVTVDVGAAFNCSQVTFTAQGATGQTPLSFDWTVDAVIGRGSVATGTGNPFVWDVAPGLTPGDYEATVTVDNTVGPPVMATSPVVTISSLLPLAFVSGPTADPFTGSTVQFHVDADGATEWNWDFGDGTSTGFISDPVAGPNPQHTYTLSGMYDVTVQVRNCVEGPITSNPLSIDVTVEPLNITTFFANCPLGFCFFDAGETVTFSTAVQGTPEAFDYDWDGNGTFEEISATVITQHIYCQAGSFEPVLRVRRGLDLDVLADTNGASLTIGTGTSCSGPTAPAGLTAAVSGGSILLSWADLAAGELGYRVLRSIDGGATFLPIATLPANANAFTDSALEPEQLYTYRVQVFALTGVGNSNDASATLSINVFADGFESGNFSAWSDVKL